MKCVPLLLALGFGVSALAAQEPRLAARLDPDAARAVQVLVDSARAAGLPTEPLVLKALEGQSKQAPAPRIVAAVGQLLGNLREARLALGAAAPPADLVAGANALRAGIAPATLAALRRERKGEVAVPLSVLADLVARGVAPAAASRAIGALVERGVSDREFLDLRLRIEADIRSGTAPGSALDRGLSGLPAAAPPRRP